MNNLITGLLIIAGIVVGFFVGRQYFPICDTGDIAPPPRAESIIEKDAHKKSVNYRTVKAYCEAPDEHQNDGYFLMSDADFSNAIECQKAIVAKCTASGMHAPMAYRFIFGADDGVDNLSRMMMVGLDAQGQELIEDGFIQIISNPLPCPIECGGPSSTIIFGANGNEGCQ